MTMLKHSYSNVRNARDNVKGHLVVDCRGKYAEVVATLADHWTFAARTDVCSGAARDGSLTLALVVAGEHDTHCAHCSRDRR